MAIDVCHIVRFPSRQSKICQNAFSIAKKLAKDGKRFGRKTGIINRQRSELKPTVQINPTWKKKREKDTNKLDI